MSKTFSYNKLWKLLIDRNMKRTDLKDISEISTVSLAKLGKGENITTSVPLKICEALDCDVADIMEVIDSENSKRSDWLFFKDSKSDRIQM